MQQLCAEGVLANGRIITVDVRDSIVEALAIEDGAFIATGSTARIRELVGARTEVPDLEGKTMLPGIIDSHTHPGSIATRLPELGFRQPQVRSVRDVLQMVRGRSAELEPGAWVRGAGFNDSKLAERRRVTRGELDEAGADDDGSRDHRTAGPEGP